MTDISLSTADKQAAINESRQIAALQRKYKNRVLVTQVALSAIALAIWQLGAGRLFDPFYSGTPLGIFQVLIGDLQDWRFYRDLYVTGVEMGLGYFFGAFFGILLGALFARWRFIADVLDPYFVALNSIPRIALAPLLVIWFGIDLASKIVLSATLVFFLTFFSTLSGIRGVDRGLLDVSRVMGANDRQIFLKVLLPGAVTWVVSGLRLSLPFALTGVIVGEFLAAASGLGFRLNMYSTSYNTNGTFAMLLVMMVIMMLLNALLNKVEARALRWRGTSQSTQMKSF
jgi:NitT/TauT family transport system permease protein